MTRGIVMIAFNNAVIDYVKMALFNASLIRQNMPDTKICLILDKQSIAGWDVDVYDRFDDVVVIDPNEKFENVRTFKDTQYFSTQAKFRNESRSLAYNLSPYDETLLIDVDYLIYDNSLSNVWGCEENILINKNAQGLDGEALLGPEFRLEDTSIRMYWATVVYFKKCDEACSLFDLVEHVKDNWNFYQSLYGFPGRLFRNDYAFSIAIHMLNGFIDSNELVKDLPISSILTAHDTDQIFELRGPGGIVFFVNSKQENWKFWLSKLMNVNVHCMNKLSLMNAIGTTV